MEWILAGAGPDTSNLGVSALCESIVVQITQRLPDTRFVVLDSGQGVREDVFRTEDGDVRYLRMGAHHSKRWYRSNAWTRIHLASRLGGFTSPEARRIRAAGAILDVSGGDSFTDLYGMKRFRSVSHPKALALRCGIPLVLLPQTYGPFQSARLQAQAATFVRGARVAWARDAASYDRMKELLEEALDPERHRSGVDVAFLLGRRAPDPAALGEIAGWLGAGDPVVGMNVSGLVFNRPESAKAQFGFRADYRAVVERLIEHILTTSRARVVLVPHVLAPPGTPESDRAASETLAREVGIRFPDRITTVRQDLDQAETKWLIARTDWFCGTRMHATIGGLSSGVPTAAIAYSLKTRGVFDTCGMGHCVADPMRFDTDDVVRHLVSSWEARAETKTKLEAALGGVLARGREQFDHIVGVLKTLR